VASQNPDTGTSSEDALAAAGIVVTPEGKARARERLRAADQRWTPELEAELRAQIGLPARAA
jgi:hypothetical protein